MKEMTSCADPTLIRGKSCCMVLKGMKILRFIPLLSPWPIRFRVPTTWKRVPFSKIVLPIEGRPGNNSRRDSSPKTTTARFCESSKSLTQRPSAMGMYRSWLNFGRYSHQASAALEEVANRPDVSSLQDRDGVFHIGALAQMSW